MAQSDYYPRKKRGGLKYIPIAVVMMLIAVIIGLSAFFRIMVIEVEGNEIYSDDEIIKVSGIELTDNLVLLRDSSVAAKICGELPYVDEVKIVRKIPDTVTLSVTESYPIAYILSDGEFWIIDKNCRLLEQTNEAGTNGLICVSGLTAADPVAGSDIKLGEDDSAVVVPYVTKILNAIYDLQIYGDVKNLDATNISDITFIYKDTYTIEVGSGDSADTKLQLAVEIINSQGDGQTGTINVSDPNEAHFIPGR